MKAIYILIFMLFISFNLSADIGSSIKKGGNSIVDFYNQHHSQDSREESIIAANVTFSPMRLPFLVSYGVNIYYVINSNWMVGIDYLSSGFSINIFSFNIAEIGEKEVTLLARRFIGNSFNLKFGLGERFLKAQFAKSLYDLTTNQYSGIALDAETKFIKLGFGNQWQFKKHYTLAVDWFSINIPFSSNIIKSTSQYAKSEETKKDIKKYEKILSFYPSGSILQFNIGLMF